MEVGVGGVSGQARRIRGQKIGEIENATTPSQNMAVDGVSDPLTNI